MRFTRLTIENFKAIHSVHLTNLTDFVLIAGPNGCGKSCIFDAIRLVKSIYGGYNPNEWQQWFGEFQIDISKPVDFRRVFRDPSRPVTIEAGIELSEGELSYIGDHAEDILEPQVWRRVTGQDSFQRRMGLASQFREFGDQVKQQVAKSASELRRALDTKHDTLRVDLEPTGNIRVEPNTLMEIVFEIYDPQHIGIIDYHSSSRNYQRESLGGVDLNIRARDERWASQSLYNWQNKYQNIKTELAMTFIRDLLAQHAGVKVEHDDLNDTLKELFRTFFPDKEYLGVLPDPDGSLRFPVRTSVGEHDINELSSGEKEIVYGYLRLRNSAPRNSTILIDEPELHLNPGLLRGMPAFYHQHLGKARGNQLWLVTHSDALLRDAVGNSNYSVFHMSPPLEGIDTQVAEVTADDELERATIALVGDLASYQPRSKVIIFEGGGETEFDVLATQRLFPEVAKRANLVSGGPKRRVRDLHDVLTDMAEKVGIANRFFTVVDRDSEASTDRLPGARQFSWDRYHIENYLLSEAHILSAANEVCGRKVFSNDEEVTTALEACAAAVAPSVVIDRLRRNLGSEIVGKLNISGNPAARTASDSLRPALEASFSRLDTARRELLEEGGLESLAAALEKEAAQSVRDGSWRSLLPGRAVLKRLVSDYLRGAVNYEVFRLLIIGRMADDGFEPDGMKSVLYRILESDTNELTVRTSV